MRRTDAAVVMPGYGMTTAALPNRAPAGGDQPRGAGASACDSRLCRPAALSPFSPDAVVFATALRALATDDEQARRSRPLLPDA
jgi:hypothetical protein